HVQLRIEFVRIAPRGIETLDLVQIIDVLTTFYELSVRTIQRIEEPVAAEMSDDLAVLTADDCVIEHVNADLVVIPRIIRRVLKMPCEFSGIDVDGHS